MLQLLLKGVISGAIVVAASELSRRSSLLGAVLVSLPLTSILALAWLYVDTRDPAEVVDLSWAILWIVLPSVVFFVALPLLVRAGFGVPLAMAVAAAIMVGSYAGYVKLLGRLGVGGA